MHLPSLFCESWSCWLPQFAKIIEVLPLLPATKRGLLHVTRCRAQSCSTRTLERELAAPHCWIIELDGR